MLTIIRKTLIILGLLGTINLLTSCVVKEYCFATEDCPSPKICSSSGSCLYQCLTDDECGFAFTCVSNQCIPKQAEEIICPEDMANIANLYCLDIYEASKSDATDIYAGNDDSRAVSQKGVLPWQIDSNAAAALACENAGKRLCSPMEWEYACQGTQATLYVYGNGYEPQTCNGIDVFGRDAFRLMPTGSFEGCVNEWGVYDLCGNLWEHVQGGNDMLVRGGAYNCGDSKAYHKCSYVPGTWTPSARGFRCCLSPESQSDVGFLDIGETDVSNDLDEGCIVDDLEVDVDNDNINDIDPDDLDVFDTAEDTFLGICPADMVPIADYCIDRYEASRPDATEANAGVDNTYVSSRPGVLPWYVSSMNLEVLSVFDAACRAAGKRLCTKDEWVEACNGPNNTVYNFGNQWNQEACNCMDTFCDDYCAQHGISSCDTSENCGYDYNCYHVMPTGSFPNCTNEYGLYDVNGNVWEIVSSEGPRGYEVRGGAFNCGAPSVRLQCAFNATWDGLYAGFRCCKNQELLEENGSIY